jgi:uncharacterized caspase-like protein
MGIRTVFWQLVLAAALFLVSASAMAATDRRVALVIGNGAYKNTAPLANPANDAQAMATALKQVGFDVIFAHDLDKRSMERAIVQFARAAQSADAALFYYAGHGIQRDGVNYLVPTDARLEDEFSLNFELTRVGDVLSALDRARGVKILVLDACRNNPLADRLVPQTASREATGWRGLARIDAVRGMVIAYAAQPNQVAIDGQGDHSPFTAALLKHIDEPGVEIGALFRRVAADVNRATHGRQLPELSVSLFGDFYLNERETDVQAWAKVRDTGKPEDFRQFLHDYPKSILASDARTRLAAIENGRVLQAKSDSERQERERLAREEAVREKARQEQERQLHELAERERIAHEKMIREIAENDKREREQLAKEVAELAKARQEQERQLREQVDKARLEREQFAKAVTERQKTEHGESERLASAEKERALRQSAPQTSPAQSPDGTPPSQAAPQKLALQSKPEQPLPPSDNSEPSTELLRDLQKQLQRVGCYVGAVDGHWGPKSKEAVRNFLRHTGQASASDEATPATLKAITTHKDRVCPRIASRTPATDRPAAPQRPRGEGAAGPTGDNAIRARIEGLRSQCRGNDIAACQRMCSMGLKGACGKAKSLASGNGRYPRRGGRYYRPNE